MSKNKHNRNNPNYSTSIDNTNVTTSVVETNDIVEEIDEDDVNDMLESEVVETEDLVVEVPDEIVEPDIDSAVEMSVVIDNAPIKIKTGFRVGTSFETADGDYTNFDQACKNANDQTKLTGEINHVYDLSGEIVFSAKKKLAILSNINKKRGMRRC